MIPTPIKFQLPDRKGYITGFWRDKKFSVANGPGEPLSLNESQAHILRELNRSKEGLTASELSKRLELTHAGVIFLVRPLVETNIVQRAEIRGGGILYYMTATLREEPSPKVKQAIAEIEAKSGQDLRALGVKQLVTLSSDLPSGLRHALIDWLLSGGT